VVVLNDLPEWNDKTGLDLMDDESCCCVEYKQTHAQSKSKVYTNIAVPQPIRTEVSEKQLYF
jgi:hypothetical protein